MNADPLMLLNAVPLGLCRLDRTGGIVWTNPAAQDLLGGCEQGLWPLADESFWSSLPHDETVTVSLQAGVQLILRCRATPIDGGALLVLEPARRDEDLLQQLFDRAPIALALFSGPEHRFKLVNQHYQDMFLGSRRVNGERVSEVLPEAVTQGFIALLDQVYRSGERYVGREAVFEMPGRPQSFHLNFVFEPFRQPNGPVEGVLVVCSDVSEQVHARDQAQQAALQLGVEQQKLEAIFNCTPASMALYRGQDLVVERINPEFQAIFGDRELLGRPLFEAAPELAWQGFGELLQGVLSSGQTYVGRERLARISPRRGAPLKDHYYDFSYHRVLDPQGETYGVYSHGVDVTDRVLARRKLEANEERLRCNEEQLSRAIAVSGVGFYDWDIAADRVTFSEQMQHDWGVEDGVSLQAALERIHPDDRLRVHALIRAAMEERRPYRVDYRVVRPDGSEIWVEAQGTVTFGEKGPVRFFGTSVDITAKHQHQRELQAAKEAAEQANATKTAFLANMSHEIRTPLGVILGFTDLLRQPQLDAASRELFLDAVDRNGRAVARIIADILDLARVESGKLLVELSDFSLAALVNEVVDLFAPAAAERRLRLGAERGEAAAERIHSDPARLRQILINLVGNAVKFTHQGEVTVTWRVRPAGEGLRVEVLVRDSGVGIEAEQRQRLFQPFVQADESTTRRYGGTGLGLALSHRLAQALGGGIELLPAEPDRPGSVFRIEFGARPAGPETPLFGSELPSLEGLHLLLADDAADNRLLLGHLLTSHGATLELVEDGEQAVERALARRFDAVLLDVQMPALDGLGAVRQLRERGYSGPVLALTAHAMAHDRERSLQAGFDAHLTKPVDVPELLQTLTALCRPAANPATP